MEAKKADLTPGAIERRRDLLKLIKPKKSVLCKKFRPKTVLFGHCFHCLLAAALGLSLGCQGTHPIPPTEPTNSASSLEPDVPVWFKDVTKEAGLNFVHDAG